METKFSEKSPFIKKTPEMKSYQFETLFSKTFFLAPEYDFIQKRHRKKFFYSRKFMGTKDVHNHAKKGQLILKTQNTDA